jgi:sugar lactone lactonase YvrE
MRAHWRQPRSLKRFANRSCSVLLATHFSGTSSSNAGRSVGYSGVTVWTPEGKLIGRIRLPEICGNVCFGGPKRNRLFMAASQSLYALYVGTQGAAPG